VPEKETFTERKCHGTAVKHSITFHKAIIYVFNYTDLSQHNNINTYVYSLQRHVSTRMSHLQAITRTIFVYKVTVPILLFT
jgi:hypothetical protein